MSKFIILILMISGCSQPEIKIPVAEKLEVNEKLKFNNPCLFAGSNFINYMQGLHKQGAYIEMLRYTSKSTKDKFSVSSILEFYKEMQFSYPLELKAVIEENGHYKLILKTSIQCTTKSIQVDIDVEDDTCRLVLFKLDKDRPFVGY